jgi:hypothetical protein
MRHPLHILLMRWLDSEQFAFDSSARELWQSAPWPSHADDAGSRSGREPRSSRIDGAYRESEASS